MALAQSQREQGVEGVVVVTADEPLLRKLEGTQYAQLAVHIADIGDLLPFSR